jgi:hypothetical protein
MDISRNRIQGHIEIPSCKLRGKSCDIEIIFVGRRAPNVIVRGDVEREGIILTRFERIYRVTDPTPAISRLMGTVRSIISLEQLR